MTEREQRLQSLLCDAHRILSDMAAENRFKPNGGIYWNPFHRRWPIHHEPLRADARALLPSIEREIFPSKRLNPR